METLEKRMANGARATQYRWDDSRETLPWSVWSGEEPPVVLRPVQRVKGRSRQRANVGPLTDQDVADLCEEFRHLADLWERETEFLSVSAKAAMHWAYQRIIGMGPRAIPLILDRMQSDSGHWFWALNAITGEDPAAGERTLNGATERWLEWGRNRGYLRERR
jgi:hypothetical protein